jgi:hypothetical protein
LFWPRVIRGEEEEEVKEVAVVEKEEDVLVRVLV